MARLGELALLFLRLGTVAFGGPAAHIGMFEEEVIRRRQWLTHEEFLDLLGVASLVPGPTSTQMAAYVGRKRAGILGLMVAGACFVLPASIMVAFIAAAYVRYGELPRVAGILYGVKPVVIAVVVQALWGLRKAAYKSRFLTGVGVAALVASFLGANVLIVLLGTGAFVAAAGGLARRWHSLHPPAALLAATPVALKPLFLFFLKVGGTVIGSGYVLLAFLRADLVQHYGWLTEGKLLDAIAVGQVTPGPVFTTATFIGYLLAGVPGAVVATVGIFLPGFIYVGLSAPLLPRLRSSQLAAGFLDGVNVGALALMATITWHLGGAAITDAATAVMAAVSAALLLGWRVSSTWLILAGAAAGLVLKWAGG